MKAEEMEVGDKFCLKNPEIYLNWSWMDLNENIDMLRAHRFVCEYVGPEYIRGLDYARFKVYCKDADGVLNDYKSQFRVEFIELDTYLPYFVRYAEEVQKKVDNSRFPHKCTVCQSPAYIGGQNNCECSNQTCSLYKM